MESIEIRVACPLGPSEDGSGFGTSWNNQSSGTDGPVTCEICGKNHPQRKDGSYILSAFLGKQVVEECCGAILDTVYAESGEEMVIRFVEEFSRNPTDPRFLVFRSVLAESLAQAQKVLAEAVKEVDLAAKSAAAIDKK